MEGIVFIIILVLCLIIIPGMRVVRQFERGVVFTLGKYTGVKGPGLRVIIPYIQTMQRVDVRTTPIDVPKQEVITKDNVTVGVDAIVYFRVLDPSKALLETTNYIYATTNFAQAALRDITGNFELDELLSKRDEISAQIKEIVDLLKNSDLSTVKIGARFGVTRGTIEQINGGKTYYNPDINYPIRKTPAVCSALSKKQVLEIIDLLKNTNMSIRSIAKKYNTVHGTVTGINNGTTKKYRVPSEKYPIRKRY